MRRAARPTATTTATTTTARARAHARKHAHTHAHTRTQARTHTTRKHAHAHASTHLHAHTLRLSAFTLAASASASSAANAIAAANQLCTWSSKESLCVEAHSSRDAMIASETRKCDKPMTIEGGQLTNQADLSRCTLWVDQPVTYVNIDSESQAMYYHWWASWQSVYTHWEEL